MKVVAQRIRRFVALLKGKKKDNENEDSGEKEANDGAKENSANIGNGINLDVVKEAHTKSFGNNVVGADLVDEFCEEEVRI